MGESYNIFRYLGAKLGYYPSDPILAFKSDQILEAFKGVIESVNGPMFEKNPEAKKEKLEIAFTKTVVAFLDSIQEDCKKGVFLTCDSLSVADFVVGAFYISVFANSSYFASDKAAECLAKYPDFKAYGERFVAMNQGRLKDNMNKYPM